VSTDPGVVLPLASLSTGLASVSTRFSYSATVMASEFFKNPQRIELLNTLSHEIGDVFPFTWACLWVSDIKCLEELVRKARESPNDTKYMLDGIAWTGDFEEM